MDFQTYTQQVATLTALAEILGLRTVGWVAVPNEANTPEITLTVPGWTEESGWEPPYWVCPHCHQHAHTVSLVEAGTATFSAEAVDNYGLNVEQSTPIVGTWSAYNEGIDESTTEAFACPSCGGFVRLADTVDWN